MDYLLFGGVSTCILAALTFFLARALGRSGCGGARSSEPIWNRTIPAGFAAAGAGAILMIGSTLTWFQVSFEHGVATAIGVVLTVLGLGFGLGVRVLFPKSLRRRQARPKRRIPRLSDL